jgi:hypothetical protein
VCERFTVVVWMHVSQSVSLSPHSLRAESQQRLSRSAAHRCVCVTGCVDVSCASLCRRRDARTRSDALMDDTRITRWGSKLCAYFLIHALRHTVRSVT